MLLCIRVSIANIYVCGCLYRNVLTRLVFESCFYEIAVWRDFVWMNLYLALRRAMKLKQHEVGLCLHLCMHVCLYVCIEVG